MYVGFFINFIRVPNDEGFLNDGASIVCSIAQWHVAQHVKK